MNPGTRSAGKGIVAAFPIRPGNTTVQAPYLQPRSLDLVEALENMYLVNAVFEDLKVKVEESLKRMNTESVDVFLCPHGASDPANVRNDRMKEVLTKLKEAKLVRHLGFSSHTNTVSTCTAAIEDGFYDVVLTVIKVCTQNAEKAGQLAGKDGKGRPVEDTRELVKAAQKKNVGLLAMKVANGGYLTPATDDLLAKEFPGPTRRSRAPRSSTRTASVRRASAPSSRGSAPCSTCRRPWRSGRLR